MVMRWIGCLLAVAFSLEALPTNNVDVDVPWGGIYENTPFTVTLSITHDSQDKIDPISFMAGKNKINPTFIKTVKISVSSPLEISIYEVKMPGLSQGLQILPVFSVNIGGKTYSSIPTGFEVKKANSGGTRASPQSVLHKKAGGAELKLESVFTGTNPLYPGQRFYLGYRYLYNASIDLSEETLPLLEAKGFKKIGEKQISNGEENGKSVTQAIQKVEAVAPGVYSFGPSKIVGYSYVLDPKGQKIYQKTPLISELTAADLQVAAFPEKGKPASFQGALGAYSFQAKLVGSSDVQVGDKIQLLLTITGTGEMETVLAPDLCCQPGFSGFFKKSDLPPEAKVEGNTKTILVDLYVENPDTTAIPPIEFSFFNPKTASYGRISSEKIPLTVHGSQASPPAEESQTVNLEKQAAPRLPRLAVKSFPAVPLLPLTVFGLAALVFQTHFFKRKEELALLKKPLPSRILYDEALQKNEKDFYPLAAEALRQKLFEEGHLPAPDASLESIEVSEKTELPKHLLNLIENARFSTFGIDKAELLGGLKKVFVQK